MTSPTRVPRAPPRATSPRWASKLPVSEALAWRSHSVLKDTRIEVPAAAVVMHTHKGLPTTAYSNARARQLRPRVPGKGGATSYQLRQYAEATLGGGSLRKVVKLPEGEDENEWLAVNCEHALYP